jgi:hypothetical protein
VGLEQQGAALVALILFFLLLLQLAVVGVGLKVAMEPLEVQVVGVVILAILEEQELLGKVLLAGMEQIIMVAVVAALVR